MQNEKGGRVKPMKEYINRFARLLKAQISIEEKLTVERRGKLFLLTRDTSKIAREKGSWLYAGTYLGEAKAGMFYPSFPLLFMLAGKAENKVFLDDKSAWLFVCGRDIFKEGILTFEGSGEAGAYTLVMNKHGECLGFGKITKNLGKLKKGLAVKNIMDIGDFLRREKAGLEA